MNDHDGHRVEPPDERAAHRFWRHQVLLSLLAIALGLFVAGMTVAAAKLTALPHASLRIDRGAVVVAHPAQEMYRFVLWPSLAGIAAAVVLLAAAVIHSVRVATFTLRGHG